MYAAAPYPVRPRPYLNFEKEKAAAAARRNYRGLTWLGRARLVPYENKHCNGVLARLEVKILKPDVFTENLISAILFFFPLQVRATFSAEFEKIVAF